MRIIEDGAVVEDRWTRLEVDAPVPATGAVLVPLATWRAQRDVLAARGDVGVWLEPDEELDAIVEDLDVLASIAFHFPRFADGRPYSRARLLRERYEYDGPVRAFGDVLRDQVHYLHRCGFDVLEIRHDRDPEDALAGLSDFSVALQPAAQEPPSPAQR